MVKKVTLDTLEVEEDDPPLRSDPSPVKTEQEERLKSVQWRPFLQVGIPLIVLSLFIAAGVLYRGVARQEEVAPAVKKAVQPSPPLPARVPAAQANDFTITLRDERGNDRVLICDLAFELNANQEAKFPANILEVRRIIYEILGKKAAPFLTDPEARRGLKEEIIAELSSMLGKGVIRTVYFTKYIII